MELKEKVIERLDKAILDYIRKNTDTMDRFMYRLEVYSSFRNELDKNEYLIPQLKVLYGCNDLLVAIRTSVLRNTNGVVDPSYDELVSNFVTELYLEQRTKELVSRVEKEQQEIQSEIQEKSPQEVVDEAYRITTINDIVNLIKSNYLNGQEIDALLTYPNILGAIYDEWISGSYTSNDELKYCLIKCVELRYEDLKTVSVKVDVNKEALEVWEQMYDINGDLQFPVYDETLDEETGEEFEP